MSRHEVGNNSDLRMKIFNPYQLEGRQFHDQRIFAAGCLGYLTSRKADITRQETILTTSCQDLRNHGCGRRFAI